MRLMLSLSSRLYDLGVQMSPSVLPLIQEADYPGFQRLITELRSVEYSEWTDDHNKAVTYRRTRNGSQEIPISPAEFDAWLKLVKEPGHLELLWVFAEDKAAREIRPNRAAAAALPDHLQRAEPKPLLR